MSFDSDSSRKVSTKTLFALSILLLLVPGVLSAAESGAGLSATGKVDEAISPEMRTYLQLQEQLHATQLDVERNRKESADTALQTAEAVSSGMKATTDLSARMKALEELLNNQKSGEWQAMQSSNRTMLIVAGTFASFGFVALFMLGYFQWRTINRLAEISAILPRPGLALPPQAPRAALMAGDSIVTAPSPHSADDPDLLQMLARLEKRLLDLEQGATSASELHQQAAAETPHLETNGNSNGMHSDHNGHGETESTSSIPSPESERVTMLLGKGQSLLNVEKAEEALECFEQALAIEPQNPDALVKKGAALEKMRKLTEAIECYDRAIAADGTMTIAYLYKGGLCNRLERFNEALQCYEQALRTQEKRAA